MSRGSAGTNRTSSCRSRTAHDRRRRNQPNTRPPRQHGRPRRGSPVSEYQYYEFLAVDRPLKADQLDVLRALSTRAEITSTTFVNTYNWGDFRGDPRALMEGYFDAFLYTANWGTRRLMVRLPARLLDLETAQRYCRTDSATAWAHGEHVIIELCRENGEEGYWEEESGHGQLASIIPARTQLASGDLRLLYVGWLLSISAESLHPVSYTHLRAHETPEHLVCRLLLA